MKVTLDAALCQGHGRCLEFAAQVFDLDDEGHAVLRTANGEVPADATADVQRAVGNCPERALSLQP